MTDPGRAASLLFVTLLVVGACNGDTDSPNVDGSVTPSVTAPNVVIPDPTPTTSPSKPHSTSSTVVVPASGDLLVVGDWGSGTLPQGAVAGAMERYATDNLVEAILTVGDNFYLDDPELLMAPFSWTADIPFWITWGNHDVESDTRIAAMESTFDDPPRWTVWRWGSVDVLILDSNQITDLAQARFFVTAMAESSRPMIVTMHHPPYSCSHHGATTDVVNQLVGVFDEDVKLVLAGHDHNYQRFESVGVTYVVSGGGGRALYPVEQCPANHPELLAAAEVHHFLTLTQEPDGLHLTVYDVNGEVVDDVLIDLG